MRVLEQLNQSLHAVMAEEYDEAFDKYAARVAEEFTA